MIGMEKASGVPERHLLLRTKILSKLKLGVFLVTEYYSNGDVETYEAPEWYLICPTRIEIF